MGNNNYVTKNFMLTVLKTTVISVLLNLIILVIARNSTNTPLTFGPFMHGPVILFTILGVIGASGVYLVIKKYTKHYTRVFKIVSYGALFLSCIPDLQLPSSLDADNIGATPTVVGILILMHITTALVVIHIFTKNEKTV